MKKQVGFLLFLKQSLYSIYAVKTLLGVGPSPGEWYVNGGGDVTPLKKAEFSFSNSYALAISPQIVVDLHTQIILTQY